MLYESLVPRFDLRNFELACLANEVAIDLDNLILGKENKNRSTRYLSGLLVGLIEEGLSVSDKSVLSRAICGPGNFVKYWNGKNAEDLLLEVSLASKDLAGVTKLAEDNQKNLRSFCLNLSREVRCYQNNLRGI